MNRTTIALTFQFLAKPEISHVDIFEKHSFESVPLKYEVIAHGIPKPEAVWLQDGKEIKADGQRTFITVDKVSNGL